MTNTRLTQRIADFQKATGRLCQACEQPDSSFIRDSVIQRFEFCWELSWKALKLQLSELGIHATNPRDVYKEALAAELISNGNLWTEAQRMRNLTSHTYDEALALQVYQFVKDHGQQLFKTLAETMNGWSA